jgi:hypothetical protein
MFGLDRETGGKLDELIEARRQQSSGVSRHDSGKAATRRRFTSDNSPCAQSKGESTLATESLKRITGPRSR